MKVLGSALFSAVEAGDIDYLRGVLDSCTESEIQELLVIRREESAQIQRPSNSRDIYVRSPTPLMVAVTEGQDKVLEYMASYKVSKNYAFSVILWPTWDQMMVTVTEGRDGVLEYMASYKVSKNNTSSIYYMGHKEYTPPYALYSTQWSIAREYGT